MATLAFQLRPARLTDLSSIAAVWAAAFFDDEIIGEIMHPHRNEHPDDVYWFLLRGIRERFWDWRHQFMVITDGGKVVGAADWRRLGKGGETRELWRADPRNLISPALKTYHSLSLTIFPNRAADPSRSAFLDTAVAKSEKYWTGERTECWDLHVCGVHPDYQGKGVGRLLAEWGVQEAKKEGDNVVASVLCGEKNRGFYGKAGLGVQVGGTQGKGGGIALFTR
ncbi:acyl-CoA N-acyltransferase [Paraphoma chrysanthemicola]|nr:acyl-CoA N-acyltransferase [Paraphoma chrysanthemicola]